MLRDCQNGAFPVVGRTHYDSVLIKTIDYDRKLSMKQLKFKNKIVAIFNVCNHGNKLKENIFFIVSRSGGLMCNRELHVMTKDTISSMRGYFGINIWRFVARCFQIFTYVDFFTIVTENVIFNEAVSQTWSDFVLTRLQKLRLALAEVLDLSFGC